MHHSKIHRYVVHNLAAALWFTVAGVMHAHAAGIVGTGTAASCTETALNTALNGGGNVTFNCGGAASIALTTTKNVSLDTNIDGGGVITLDGNASVRHFFVAGPSNFTLANLTLYNGKATGQGGAMLISSAVNVVLTNVAMNQNKATLDGGAIASPGGGTLALTDILANGNQAGGTGGVVFAGDTATLSLTRFSASNNAAAGGGGAVSLYGTALTIDSSGLGGNSATSFGSAGGAVLVNPASSATFSIVNSTFEGNTASNAGTGAAVSVQNGASGTINYSTFGSNAGQGAIEVAGNGTAHLKNTIVSNTTSSGNCSIGASASIVDDGNNLQFGGTISKSCGNGIPEVDPKLGPFANNGGFTNTMALLAGSPAINAGSASCPLTDQRGVARPIGGASEIGAYEAPASATAPMITNGPPPGGTVGTAYNFTYTATGSAPIAFTVPPGTLPPGLNLSSAGAISGTPTLAGTYTGTVTATNGTQPDATQPFSITVAPAPQPSAAAATAPSLSALGMLALIILLAIAGTMRSAIPKRKIH